MPLAVNPILSSYKGIHCNELKSATDDAREQNNCRIIPHMHSNKTYETKSFDVLITLHCFQTQSNVFSLMNNRTIKT